MCQRLRAEGNSELHSGELEKSMLERAVEEDVERERQHLNQAHANLAKTQARRAKKAALQEAKALQALREMKHDVQMEEVLWGGPLFVCLFTCLFLAGREGTVEPAAEEECSGCGG